MFMFMCALVSKERGRATSLNSKLFTLLSQPQLVTIKLLMGFVFLLEIFMFTRNYPIGSLGSHMNKHLQYVKKTLEGRPIKHAL